MKALLYELLFCHGTRQGGDESDSEWLGTDAPTSPPKSVSCEFEGKAELAEEVAAA